jgi:hypothetical protein
MGLKHLSGLGWFSVYSGFSLDRLTQGSVDGTETSVWFRMVFGLLRFQ